MRAGGAVEEGRLRPLRARAADLVGGICDRLDSRSISRQPMGARWDPNPTGSGNARERRNETGPPERRRRLAELGVIRSAVPDPKVQPADLDVLEASGQGPGTKALRRAPRRSPAR